MMGESDGLGETRNVLSPEKWTVVLERSYQ